MNNNYCMNCGKCGHNNKCCIEPIISCGIICFKIDKIFTSPIKKIEEYLFNKYINIEDYNYKNLNYISKFNSYKNNIKFLLIQRKHSLSFIQFIHGTYDEKSNENLKYLFNLMSKTEVENIKKYDFEYLWNKVWLKTAKNKLYQKEFILSKKKFYYLKDNKLLEHLDAGYDNPEWGFPKGRRNKYENNINCAKREFVEETGLKNYNLYHRLNCVEETFYGTNKVEYKHIYYIAGTTDDNLDFNIIDDSYEIGNLGWFTIDQVLKLLRPYSTSKKDLINQLFFFLNILIHKISDKNNIKKLNKNNKICNEIEV